MGEIQEKEQEIWPSKKIYGYIYKITNKINQKIYIGQTSRTIAIRWKDHCSVAYRKTSKDYNLPLYRAIRKYGTENFLIEEVDYAFSQEELDLKEIQYIEKYNSYYNGYNASLGGSGHKKYNYSEIVEYYLAHKSLQKTCQHFQIYDQVVYSALSAAGIKPQKEANLSWQKKAKRYILCIETQHIFNSMAEIDRYFNKTVHPNIRRCLDGITEKAYGFHWKESDNLYDLLDERSSSFT